MRFDGSIAGLGSSSGHRFVVGMWARSPFGPFVDVMVETDRGHRVLLAPSREVADFIASTYTFDEIRVGTVTLHLDRRCWTVRGPSLSLTVGTGARTGVGRLLAVLPSRVTTAPAWCRAVDPLARRLRPGVRTTGSAGNGRREYYGAHDEHAITTVDGTWAGDTVGTLRDVTPPVRFGFGSAPRRPALVGVITTVDVP